MSFKVKTEVKWAGDQYILGMYSDMLKAYGKSADRIRNAARSKVPVSKETKSIHLIDTIRARTSEEQNAAFVFAGDRSKKVFYAHMVEYGTYERPANPFMRSALDSNFNPTKAESERTAARSVNAKRRFTRDTRADQVARAMARRRNQRGQFV